MVYYFNGQRQFKQNRLFTTNQRQFSRTLRERMAKHSALILRKQQSFGQISQVSLSSMMTVKSGSKKLKKKVQRQADITIPKRDVKKQVETRFRIGNLLGQMTYNLAVKVEMLLKPTCANCKAIE